jgi:hypothetical protein
MITEKVSGDCVNMLRTKLYLIVLLFMMASFAMADVDSYKEDRQLYERVCNKCHEMQWYLWPRSFKAWELTVENMMSYAYNEEDMFTADEGARITAFVAKYVGEGEIKEPKKETVPPVVIAAVTTTPDVPKVEPAQPIVQPVQNIASKIVLPIVQRYWRPSRNALRGARVSGFLAVGCLLGLFVSGLKRKTLKMRFRTIHASLALGLFLSLATHGVIYIAKYGTPSVLWYWFGLIGLLALIITQVQGIVRKRFRRGLLVSHITGAGLAFVLSILHWVWAWL